MQSQVKTLNSTVSLLKDQLSNMKNENKVMYELNTDMKAKLNEKSTMIEKMKKEKAKNMKEL